MTIHEMMERLDAFERGDAEGGFRGLTHMRLDGPVSAPRGWSALLVRAALALDTAARQRAMTITIHEVRQKLGTMRIDATFDCRHLASDGELWSIAGRIEEESAQRCMICGARSLVDSAAYSRYVVRCGRHWRLEPPDPPGRHDVSAHGLLSARALAMSAGDWVSIGDVAGSPVLRMPIVRRALVGVVDLHVEKPPPFIVVQVLADAEPQKPVAPDRASAAEAAIEDEIAKTVGLRAPAQPRDAVR